MKLTQVVVPPLLSFAFTNLSSNVDFSELSKSTFSKSSGSDGSTQRSSTNNNGNAPLRSELGQGPKLSFKLSSTPSSFRNDQCPQPPILSCSPQAASTDSCCVVTPGGILVQAQFWDLNVGQPDSWGVHGLWPDKCNGDFYENCDSSRAYTGDQIVESLQQAGAQTTLDFMNEFWLSNDESPSEFWSHEWKTHGTCVSTLEPTCFDNYQTGQEVTPYFETVVNLFKKLDTYQALASAGITPSSSKTYTLSALQKAVVQHIGYTPDFICSGSTLGSVQYYVRAQGPLQDGEFVQSQPSRSSSCPANGIKYPVKTVDQGDEQPEAGNAATGGHTGRHQPHHRHGRRDEV